MKMDIMKILVMKDVILQQNHGAFAEVMKTIIQMEISNGTLITQSQIPLYRTQMAMD